MRYEVLLVDDEKCVTSSLKRVFKSEFAAVHESHSDAKALELLGQYPIDVVISDDAMPQMNGAHFISEIHRKYPADILSALKRLLRKIFFLANNKK